MTAKTSIHQILSDIQTRLSAPKAQRNDFGKYNYRNCEDILQALKPLLAEHKCFVTLSDEITAIGNRIYVKATAVLTDSENNSLSVSAFAREAENKKGMDESQVTGAASSYARKYALNGLFAIDDNKDADALNTHADYTNPLMNTPVVQALMQQGAQINQLPTLTDDRFAGAINAVKNGTYDKAQLLNGFSLTDAQRAQVVGL